jgi:predicted kinase
MMPKLIITRGLPGSGKTTLAKAWVADDPIHRARVNRDDLRAMAHNSVFVPNATSPEGRQIVGTERAIQKSRDALITTLLKTGMDVVVDDTGLPTRVCRELRRLAVLAGADFEVWDMTDVPLEECLARNATRTDKLPVPEDRIRDMWQRYIRGKPYPLSLPDEPADTAGGLRPYVRPEGKPKAIMVDIDGTIALLGERSPYDATRVHEDQPNEPVIAVVEAVYRQGYDVIFMSGRSGVCRNATIDWLTDHVLDVPRGDYVLHMRADGDLRKDAIVKMEIFDREVRDNYDVITVFDDRDQVVEAWRAIGLTVFQVAEGNF